MKRSRLIVAAGLVVLSLAAVGTPAALGATFDIDFAAQLQGSQEVPPVDTPANGRAVFDVRDGGDQGSIAYRLFLRKIDHVVAAHIHLGCPGENGDVVVTLFSGGPTGEVDGVLVRGLITSNDLEGPLAGRGLGSLIRRMQSGCTYVNVHTSEWPGGEIRGQVQQVSSIP
jgi:hypothetical protein